VAPLQCVDLPKSPDACPHGKALLALGLGGGDGRSVIQLCDAFSGGSATHELMGHNGGVNAVVWDPYHPFRLASGGEDGTVRLWDIRKAGTNACLGVLDRHHGYSDGGDSSALHQSKRQRLSFHDNRRMEGKESHNGPVSALVFVPGGEELVSSGSDGSIHLWDLRPDCCYVSPIVATIGKRKCDTQRGGMDPLVACGGRLCPSIFGTSGKETYKAKKRQRARRNATSSLAIVQNGSRNTTTLYATNSSMQSVGQIASYSLFKNSEKGGQPDAHNILHGHLGDITCLTPVVRAWDNLATGCYRDNNNPRLLSAGKDGMILSWGIPAKNDPADNHADSEMNEPSGSRSHILTMLKLQRQHKLERLNRQYRDGLISGRDWHDSVYDHDDSQNISVDLDSW
jgi:DNA excision repair protein ERCC-8